MYIIYLKLNPSIYLCTYFFCAKLNYFFVCINTNIFSQPLSKDHLTRVKQGVYFNKEIELQNNTKLFGIGLDCAIWFECSTDKQSY
jgi:hypothetical protein